MASVKNNIPTGWYRAPEVILRNTWYGPPIDMFATGLILAELYSLRPLFPGESEIDQIHNMISLLGSPTDKSWREGAILMKRMNLRLPPSKSPNQKSEGEDDTSEEDEKIDLRIEQIMPHGRRTPLAANLVRVLIQWNPSSRPSADEALEHAYNQTFGETKPAREIMPKSKPENAVPDQLFKSFREKVHHKSTKSNAIRDESVGRQLRSGTTKKGLNDDAQHSSRIDNQKCMISANNKEGILPNNHKFLFLGRSKIDSVAPARKESCKNDIEQENEFSSYISAVQSAVSSTSNPRSSIGNMLMPNNRGTSGRARPEETKPGRRIGNLVSTPFARRIDGVITPSARRDRISRATQNVDAGLPKKKGRRQQISQSKHHLDRKPEPMKPRWLLSKNMNMGKRAIEVTVSKTSGVDATLLENPQVSVHSEDDKVWIPF